jgi:ATP-dependent Lhr-like helicase
MPLQQFHPTVRRWFTERIGTPSAPQIQGWPKITCGGNALIAAASRVSSTRCPKRWS